MPTDFEGAFAEFVCPFDARKAPLPLQLHPNRFITPPKEKEQPSDAALALLTG